MSKVGRVATVLPVVGAVLAATALTGAAVYTVGQAGCSETGSYVRHAQYTELVGGCLGGELAGTATPDAVPSGIGHQVPRPAVGEPAGDGQSNRQ